MDYPHQKILSWGILIVLVSGAVGGGAGYFAAQQARPGSAKITTQVTETVRVASEESDITKAVEKANPAVVSVIVTKDLPVLEQVFINPFGDDFFQDPFGSPSPQFRIPQLRQQGTERREVGWGTGYIVSADGYILTNKHVVQDPDAEYTVLLNDERRFPVKVLARDPFNDIAVLKVEESNLPFIELGDSSAIKLGQTAIAIGNALGEFRNTISVGVISGLSRKIVASGAAEGPEALEDLIQTDASINRGNSGGPLLNIAGQAIGMNTAVAQGAQGIGFALPINEVKKVYESVREKGRIVRPYLGLRHTYVTKQLKEKNNLPVDHGALIVRGESPDELAILPGSPANKAGLEENDIILEVNGEKVDLENSLGSIIHKYSVGDTLELKVLHKGEEKTVKVTLEEWTGK